jgi:hypothetical protein
MALPCPPQCYYQNTLVAFLSFLDGQEYHKDTVFEQARLVAITADDLLKWMNVKAFGTANPQPDANPLGADHPLFSSGRRQSRSTCQTSTMPVSILGQPR